MRHMPNDTIVVSVGDQKFVTEFGDPGLPIDGRGGNDTMIATVDAVNGVLTFVGDDATMQGRSHGGNDLLVASIQGFGDYAVIDGDAQTMSDHAHGGNDMIHVDASTTIYTSVSLFGDAESTMTGNT
jgi:hypothetical protein